MSTKADVYTHGYNQSVLQQHAARTPHNSAAYLLPSLEKGWHILDVGCGPGSISAGFADIVTDGSVTATDISDEVLSQARKLKDGRPNLKFEVADVYQLPYKTNQFDCAHAHQVLQHLSDPVLGLKEMIRVVKPGGVIACRDADYTTMLALPTNSGIERWREIYRKTCKENKAEPDAGRYLYRWAREAGVDRHCINYNASVVVFSPSTNNEARKAWGYAWSERVLKSAFGKQALEYGLTTQEELEYLSKSWKEWADNEDSTFYYVNGEMIIKKE